MSLVRVQSGVRTVPCLSGRKGAPAKRVIAVGSNPTGASKPSTVDRRGRAMAAQPPLIRAAGPVRHRGPRLVAVPPGAKVRSSSSTMKWGVAQLAERRPRGRRSRVRIPPHDRRTDWNSGGYDHQPGARCAGPEFFACKREVAGSNPAPGSRRGSSAERAPKHDRRADSTSGTPGGTKGLLPQAG